ncbi:dihydrofolate reductase [Shimia sp.]|jgi:dihydrofolate reductase|uniref:dihydrofolate reductase n=1 Tax=unclassified Shimia TaxID=2630038 RepID=UPI0025DC7B68|nr:dihydrofolate reductase [Shimia sp.]MCH2066510.1 dihydrofolate reductase [Shimia sp.]
MISLVVGRARNGAIGRDGDIPWFLPEDLKTFQRETLGGAIIMGRATWVSLPKKPLPKRFNIVVSSQPDAAEVVVPSVAEAVKLAYAEGYHRVYGIGGFGIYSEMLPLADRLLISEVDMDVPDADTFFPEVDLAQWRLASSRGLPGEGPKCEVCEYLRR